jgi:hypothetical protein
VSDVIEGGVEQGFAYGYRPRVIGAGQLFRLSEHSLEWNVSGMSGRVAYPMIKAVRIGYRPSNFGSSRYIAEIWPRNGAKLEIASASYSSMVAMEDQSPAFNVFMRELNRRIADSGAECTFEAGFAAWRWWPMAAVGALTALALVYVGVHTMTNGDLASGALVLGFIVLFMWQLMPLILRNRPRPYDPRNMPANVLP